MSAKALTSRSCFVCQRSNVFGTSKNSAFPFQCWPNHFILCLPITFITDNFPTVVLSTSFLFCHLPPWMLPRLSALSLLFNPAWTTTKIKVVDFSLDLQKDQPLSTNLLSINFLEYGYLITENPNIQYIYWPGIIFTHRNLKFDSKKLLRVHLTLLRNWTLFTQWKFNYRRYLSYTASPPWWLCIIGICPKLFRTTEDGKMKV